MKIGELHEHANDFGLPVLQSIVVISTSRMNCRHPSKTKEHLLYKMANLCSKYRSPTTHELAFDQ